VRRLLVRVLLVLGGACTATVVGWLLCAGSANADELPAIPSVPSVPSVLHDLGNAAQVSTPDIHAVTLPRNPLPDPGLGKVTQQVRLTVPADVPAPVTPTVHAVAPKQAEQHHAVTPQAQPQHRHASTPAGRVRAKLSRPAPRPVPPAPAPVPPHKTVPPPSQPAGSSDSSAHGAGGSAGGSGGALAPLAHVLGHGLNLAGAPSTPRLAVVPGAQPGTSPD
jgi:hypothetical protein